MEGLPKQPKLFKCKKCDVFFYSFSTLDKPTHSKCFGHDTLLATNDEIDQLNKIHNSNIAYN